MIEIKINKNKPSEKLQMSEDGSTKVLVRNVRDEEIMGIPPGEEGYVDFGKYKLHQWALKRSRTKKVQDQEKKKEEFLKPIPKKEEKEYTGPVPRKFDRQVTLRTKKKIILLEAFIAACGGRNKAALYLDVAPETITKWRNKGKVPAPYRAPMQMNYDNLLALLNDDEQAIFIDKVTELCHKDIRKKQREKNKKKAQEKNNRSKEQ